MEPTMSHMPEFPDDELDWTSPLPTQRVLALQDQIRKQNLDRVDKLIDENCPALQALAKIQRDFKSGHQSSGL
jgi:hypothetical protein